MHLLRRPARVEGASYRLLGEPVDRRAPARLDVGDRRQVPSQLGLERAGRDGGQVGLEQHVVHGRRKQRVEGVRSGVQRVGGEQGAAVGGQAAERDDADHRGLLDRPGDRLGPGRGSTGPQPGQAVHERGDAGAGGEHGAGREPGELHQGRAAGLGQPGPLEVGGERVHRLAAVAGPHDPGRTRGLQPGQGEAGPAVRDVGGAPQVERVRRQPDGLPVRCGAEREQIGCVGHLHVQGRDPLVDLQQLGGGLEVAHPEAARAQRRRRRRTPVLQQQLDVAHQLEGRAGRSAVDQALVPLGRREVGYGVGGLARGAAAAQRDRDLARDRHVTAVAGEAAGRVPAAPGPGRWWWSPRRRRRDPPAPGVPGSRAACSSTSSARARTRTGSASPVSTAARSSRWSPLRLEAQHPRQLGHPRRPRPREQQLGRRAEA